MVGVLLIDLTRAFDSVPHESLLLELTDVGCGKNALQWFGSYLAGREQRVIHGAEVTPWKAVGRGVPQGSCLSPLLFNIYVRKLPSCNSTPTWQFADDVTSSVSDEQPSIILQQLEAIFNRTKAFCNEHQLKINAAKTQLLMVKTPSRTFPTELELVLDGSAILAPIAKSHLSKLDVIQKMAARTICGAPRHAHAAPLLVSLQLESLEARRESHVVSLVKKILTGDCHPSFLDYFTVGQEGQLSSGCISNRVVGKKRFKVHGAETYNLSIQSV